MKIESGIPLPNLRDPRFLKIAKEMRGGDSVLCKTASDAESLKFAIRKTGHKASQRKMDGGWRVWRME